MMCSDIYQWFSERHRYLTSQNMTHVGRSCDIADDPVRFEELSRHYFFRDFFARGRRWRFSVRHVSTILVGQLKKSFQTCRRVFGSLAFHSVRKQQYQTHLTAPFRLTRAQERIYYYLPRFSHINRTIFTIQRKLLI